MSPISEVATIFICHAHHDAEHRQLLELHLAALTRSGLVVVRHPGSLAPGCDFRTQLREALTEADIVVPLLSAHFLSDLTWDVIEHELLSASARGRVVPVVVRPCDWQASFFAPLKPLPSNGKPVTAWPDPDSAWSSVVSELRTLLDHTRLIRRQATESLPPKFPDAATRLRSTQLADAFRRRAALQAAFVDCSAIDREILSLKRALRDGGQLRPGDVLGDGRYLLLEQIGVGGFGSVWRSLNRAQNQTVAIKVLHPNVAADRLRRDRFFRGSRIMEKLSHPAFVRILEGQGHDAGWYYFVMEYVAGGDLRRAVLEGRVPRSEALPLTISIGRALAFAHAKHVHG